MKNPMLAGAFTPLPSSALVAPRPGNDNSRRVDAERQEWISFHLRVLYTPRHVGPSIAPVYKASKNGFHSTCELCTHTGRCRLANADLAGTNGVACDGLY